MVNSLIATLETIAAKSPQNTNIEHHNIMIAKHKNYEEMHKKLQGNLSGSASFHLKAASYHRNAAKSHYIAMQAHKNPKIKNPKVESFVAWADSKKAKRLSARLLKEDFDHKNPRY